MKGNCRDCPAYTDCPRMAGESYCFSAHPGNTDIIPPEPEAADAPEDKLKEASPGK